MYPDDPQFNNETVVIHGVEGRLRCCDYCFVMKHRDEFPVRPGDDGTFNLDDRSRYCYSCFAEAQARCHSDDAYYERLNHLEYLQDREGLAVLKEPKYPTGKSSKEYDYLNITSRTLNVRGAAKGLRSNLSQSTLERWWGDTPHKCTYCGITARQYTLLGEIMLAYSGNDWTMNKFKPFFKPPVGNLRRMTIDRKNSSAGYTIYNLTKACWMCNKIKSAHLTPEQMSLLAPLILKELKEALHRRGLLNLPFF